MTAFGALTETVNDSAVPAWPEIVAGVTTGGVGATVLPESCASSEVPFGVPSPVGAS